MAQLARLSAILPNRSDVGASEPPVLALTPTSWGRGAKHKQAPRILRIATLAPSTRTLVLRITIITRRTPARFARFLSDNTGIDNGYTKV